jgi:hypothetical protein
MLYKLPVVPKSAIVLPVPKAQQARAVHRAVLLRRNTGQPQRGSAVPSAQALFIHFYSLFRKKSFVVVKKLNYS